MKWISETEKKKDSKRFLKKFSIAHFLVMTNVQGICDRYVQWGKTCGLDNEKETRHELKEMTITW